MLSNSVGTAYCGDFYALTQPTPEPTFAPTNNDTKSSSSSVMSSTVVTETVVGSVFGFIFIGALFVVFCCYREAAYNCMFSKSKQPLAEYSETSDTDSKLKNNMVTSTGTAPGAARVGVNMHKNPMTVTGYQEFQDL